MSDPANKDPSLFPLSLREALPALNITAGRLSRTKATLGAGQFPLWRRYVRCPPCDGSVLEPIWALGSLLLPSPCLSLPCTRAPSLRLVFNLNWTDKKQTSASEEVKVERFALRERSRESPLPALCPGKVGVRGARWLDADTGSWNGDMTTTERPELNQISSGISRGFEAVSC